MLDVFIYSRSSCRLKSPVALSGKKFLSTKVARGARRVKIDLKHLNISYGSIHVYFSLVHLPV